jgi:type II secretory pathway component PulJ
VSSRQINVSGIHNVITSGNDTKGHDMHLVIKRNQADMKGVFGGHKGVQFSLYYRLVLTPEEEQLVSRYRLDNHVLTRSAVKVDTVRQATQGIQESMESVDVLLNNEDVIKSACDQFCKLMAVARSFGGEEIVNLPLDAN